MGAVPSCVDTKALSRSGVWKTKVSDETQAGRVSTRQPITPGEEWAQPRRLPGLGSRCRTRLDHVDDLRFWFLFLLLELVQARSLETVYPG